MAIRQATISLPVDGMANVEYFESVERLSQLFEITASVLCAETDFFQYLGDPVSITITDDAGNVRYFHGLLFEAEFVEETPVGFRYRLTLRPWAYILTRNLDYTIYQNKQAVDIVKAQFDLRNCSNVIYDKLANTPIVREYCVQYRESDFAFISRLLEEEGIYYFFKHSQSKHELVLCDGRASHPDAPYTPSLPINPTVGGGDEDFLWRWTERVSSTAEQNVVLRNWDFKQASATLEAQYSAGETNPAEKAMVYDFPAGFLQTNPGDTLSETILESARRERRLYLGSGNALMLACGQILTVSGHGLSRLNQDYLIIGLRYKIDSEQYRSGQGMNWPELLVEIEAVPADVKYRAAMRTPRPVARGPDTAIVVTGSDGEEIYTDEYGRVRVKFHWDRSSNQGDDASCWIRVSSSWAGKSFGELYLPRVGQEVVVDYLDGDPDRPLITGRVYNASLMQDLTLPDNKTKSGLRTQTTPSTTGPSGYDGAVDAPSETPGYNEIAFEDKAGSEMFTVRAQRDMTEDVYRDETRNTHRDQTEIVGRNRVTTIKTGDDTYTLSKGNESHTVTAGKRTTQIQQDEGLTVVQGNMSTTVSTGNQSTKVSTGNQSTDVSMGNISIKADLGSITVEAMQQIQLKVGSSTITLDQMGVTIKGMMISSEAQVQLQTKAVMSQHNADAMMTIKGAITMIN